MLLLLIGILGLCIGSFLNVAILRIPKNQSINFPASHCPNCLHPLKWYHNIPLFSWLFLKGRCAFCAQPISWQYPLIELFSALLYVIAYVRLASLEQAFLLGSVYALLMALSLIDLRYKAVPDMLSLPALLVAFLHAKPLDSLQNGLLFMGAFVLLRFSISALARKEVMGEADIIIAGIIGAILGIKLGCVAVYLSALIALVVFIIVRKRGFELPFIPFLSAGLFITWLFEQPILHVLESIYG
jgi:leader peptidase (prepilin peptidase)/N-methyltransferase